jgi:dihydroorotate dehydrogenase
MTKGQVLVVSVAASPDPDWKIEQIVRDYAQCARWARDAGAQAIEANLSCPNVCTKEGHLYSSAEASALIAAAMRDAASGLPVILKVGLFPNRDQMAVFVEAVGSHATALSTTNCIPATVSQPDGSPLFEGLSRGIGGECIRERCQAEIKMLKDVIDAAGSKLKLIGVGGMFCSADVRERMTEGAHHVQLATAAMLDPLVAIRIRRERAVAVDRVAGKRF